MVGFSSPGTPKSPFGAGAYPKPWPKEAFSSDPFQGRHLEVRHLAAVQQYFPHAHLPQKLVVHGPWK